MPVFKVLRVDRLVINYMVLTLITHYLKAQIDAFIDLKHTKYHFFYTILKQKKSNQPSNRYYILTYHNNFHYLRDIIF